MPQEQLSQSSPQPQQQDASASSAQPPLVTLGYNALQIGMTPQVYGDSDKNYRARVYSNLGIEGDKLHLRFQGLNEHGVEYTFGRNSLRAGASQFPVDIVVASRYLGTATQDVGVLDLGVGVRVDIGKLPLIDYGFADVIKHTGVGSSHYSGPEAVTFWGKQMGPITLESTMAKKQGAPLFAEFEVLMKPVTSVKGVGLRPYARSESFDFSAHTFTVGLQLQFAPKP
ncbi:MAG: hypothetical protein IT290_08335 [Deltaproteobacteria bacterium]|nr:hypothetical protein [Deltaproteobacteria bacterium]